MRNIPLQSACILAGKISDLHGVRLRVGGRMLASKSALPSINSDVAKKWGSVEAFEKVLGQLAAEIQVFNNRFSVQLKEAVSGLKGLSPVVDVPARASKGAWRSELLYGCVSVLADECYELFGVQFTFGNQLLTSDAPIKQFINTRNIENVFITLLKMQVLIGEDTYSSTPLPLEDFLISA